MKEIFALIFALFYGGSFFVVGDGPQAMIVGVIAFFAFLSFFKV